MNRVKVITDSTADLSLELRGKFDIEVIPLYVLFGDKSYLDGVELTTEELYQKVEENKSLPKTSAPSFGDFYDVFSRWTKEGYDVLCITISSQLSGTHQTARLVAEEFEEGRVRVFDSQNLSTGIAILALRAAELAKEGKGVEEIYQILTDLAPKIKVSFIIDTLKYLHMGGRCNSVQLLASNALKIRPQIIVKDGSMVVGAKYRGKRSYCLKEFCNDVIGNGSQVNKKRAFITHSLCSEDEQEDYRRRLETLGLEEIYVNQAGTVISSHCGPGTIGIIYVED
jgi:DegV family protein with EDD domain